MDKEDKLYNYIIIDKDSEEIFERMAKENDKALFKLIKTEGEIIFELLNDDYINNISKFVNTLHNDINFKLLFNRYK